MLIIVESPAKARTISKIVGNRHKVKASVGHIRKISDTKKTKDGRKLEINGIDIEKGFAPIFEIDPGKKKVVAELKKLAKSEKEGILFATDTDREGEAISWHLAEILGIKDKSKIKRLEFHEITKKAIEKAMENPGKLNLEMIEAQKARQVLDKLVGYKLSPVLWAVMSNYQLSAGRVQSPALVLVCQREKEIEAFKPEEYWEIKGKFIEDKVKKTEEVWCHYEDEGRSNPEQDTNAPKEENLFRLKQAQGKKLPKEVTSKDDLTKLLSDIANYPEYTITETKEKTVTIRTKPPFITSTLQQAASSKLGFAPKMTMSVAQKLYEGVNIDGEPTALITYMRTDSFNLSAESIDAARKHIGKTYPKFLPEKAKYYKSKSRNAQEAHEAIRPTDPLRTPQSLKNKLEPRLYKLYDLIWRQTIASQMTDEIRQSVTFDVQNERKDIFTGSVSWTTHLGFKAIMNSQIQTEKPKEAELYQKGNKLNLEKIFYDQKFTKPPSRYSAASLIKKLEELGIGRPSTYASIISTLTDRRYVEIESKAMKPTTLGMKISDLLLENFEQITSSELTAKMENELDDISNGKKGYKEVLDHFWWDLKKEVEEKIVELKANKEQYNSSKSDVKCPTCGGDFLLRSGRFGEYFQCQTDKSHMFAKNFREYEVALKKAKEEFADQAKGQKCEQCGKDLVVKVSKAKLKPYISCPDYRVGNKHTVKPVAKEK